jgi:hypothetical protein
MHCFALLNFDLCSKERDTRIMKEYLPHVIRMSEFSNFNNINNANAINDNYNINEGSGYHNANFNNNNNNFSQKKVYESFDDETYDRLSFSYYSFFYKILFNYYIHIYFLLYLLIKFYTIPHSPNPSPLPLPLSFLIF